MVEVKEITEKMKVQYDLSAPTLDVCPYCKNKSEYSMKPFEFKDFRIKVFFFWINLNFQLGFKWCIKCGKFQPIINGDVK